MIDKEESNFKIVIDNILIYNLYIIIIGSLLLGISYILSVNGNSGLYNLFSKLWYPIFIPSFSLFFTAILIEAVLEKLVNRGNK